jgi:hypothetical protein
MSSRRQPGEGQVSKADDLRQLHKLQRKPSATEDAGSAAAVLKSLSQSLQSSAGTAPRVALVRDLPTCQRCLRSRGAPSAAQARLSPTPLATCWALTLQGPRSGTPVKSHDALWMHSADHEGTSPEAHNVRELIDHSPTVVKSDITLKFTHVHRNLVGGICCHQPAQSNLAHTHSSPTSSPSLLPQIATVWQAAAELVEKALLEKGTHLMSSGALATLTGPQPARLPQRRSAKGRL